MEKEVEEIRKFWIDPQTNRAWDLFADSSEALGKAKKDIPALLSALEAAQEENKLLREEILEWFCVKCKTVYPGPPQQGTSCVQCPKCFGDCGPKTRIELRKAQMEAAGIKEALNGLYQLVLHEVDYKTFENGITDSTGLIDEGRVRACETIEAAREALARLKEADPCGRPCPPDTPCQECVNYWDQMRAEGLWINGKGWTDKGFKEFLK